jgi:hypothetical protein
MFIAMDLDFSSFGRNNPHLSLPTFYRHPDSVLCPIPFAVVLCI